MRNKYFVFLCLFGLLQSFGCASTHKVNSRSTASEELPPGSLNPMTPQKFLEFYHIDALHSKGWTGKGQHIAIVNLAPITDTVKETFAQYFQLIKIDPPQINYIQATADPASQTSAGGELKIDVEMATNVAPGAIFDIYSFSSPADTTLPSDFAVIFSKILENPDVKIISTSYGNCERDHNNVAAVDALLKKAADRGVTILDASGDQAWACGTYTEGVAEGANERDWPGTSPYITSVGADSIENLYTGSATEVGWHHAGGGASSIYPVPDWQKGIVPTNYKGRGIPDIAFFGGDPGFQEWYISANGQGQWANTPHGTSLAAPQMAGFIALVNQARHELYARGPIGWLNPILYSLYANNKTEFATVINDITRSDPGDHQAKPGWDSVTGLGSPNVQNLFDYLVRYPGK